MRRVSQIMGMPVSLDVRASDSAVLLNTVFTLLAEIDNQFSPYRATSEVCRYANGSINFLDMSTEGLDVFAACLDWEHRTGGYFSPYFRGDYDPTGYVKGWAIQRAADLLLHYGVEDFCINAGGDVLTSSATSGPWTIALQHPLQAGATIGTVAAGNMAIATSGTYARGDHIINPRTAQPATDLLAVTVRGPGIITADVLATTICAMGWQRGLQYMQQHPEYQALCILPDLSVHTTSGFMNPSV